MMIDLDQLDKHNILYIPVIGKTPIDKGWNTFKQSKKPKNGQNAAILTGEVSGISVIDIDVKGGGLEIWNKLIDFFEEGKEIETPTTITGSGGLHLYFKYNSTIRSVSNVISVADFNGFTIKVGIDTKSNGGQVVAAGSIHPVTKKKYKYKLDFDEVKLQEIPVWFIKCIEADYIEFDSNDRVEIIEKVKPPKTLKIREDVNTLPQDFNKDNLNDIVMNLSKDRAHNYSDWIKVCWAINSTAEHIGEDCLDIAVEFSKKSPKFSSEVDVESVYNKSNGNITIGSLWYWLKQDNPEVFNELYDQYKNKAKENYYYGDYVKLVDEYIKEGVLDVFKVRNYLCGSLVKINNGGNDKYLSLNRGNYDVKQQIYNDDEWIMLNNLPFKSNTIPFKYRKVNLENNEVKEIKTNFHEQLKLISTSSIFPIYDKLDFIPYLREDEVNYDKDRLFNLFNGFPHNPDGDYSTEIIEPIIHHMKNILCAGNEELYKYYIRYLAHIIQKPYEKAEVALMFIAPEGVGKDSIHNDFLGSVLGKKLLHRVNNISDLTRKFNKKIEGKLLTIIGEVKTYSEKIDMETLKGMITDKSVNIEPKGKDPYEINDFQRFIFHTNNTIPLGVSSNDRRFVIQKLDKSYIQSREYYNELWKSIKNPDVVLNFFKFLAQLDISEYNPKVLPQTEVKRHLQQLTLDNVSRFMIDIYKKEVKLTNCKIIENQITIHTKALFDNYLRWVSDNNEYKKVSLKSFKQKLSDNGFANMEKRIKINGVKKLGLSFSYDYIYEQYKKLIDKNEVEEIVEDIDEDDEVEDIEEDIDEYF